MLNFAAPQRKWWWILAVILSAFILRAPAFFNPIVDEDEALYAAAARVMNNGGLLYQHAVDLKPPLIFYFYSASFSILADDLRILHLATVFWVLATAVAIGFITRQLTARAEAGYLSALLYVLFTPTFVPHALATNGEIIMNLPLALSVLFFLRGAASKQYLHSCFSGMLCGVAFLVKYQSGILLGVFLIYLLLVKPLWSKAWPEKEVFARSLVVAGGYFGVLVAIYGIFRYLGNWEDFYFWGWQYNFIFMKDFTWQYFFKHFFDLTPRFILIWLILWLFAFTAIKRALQLPREIQTGRHLMAIWLAGSAAAVCAGGKFFGHYYIQLLPPLTILAAMAMVEWWQQSQPLKWKQGFVLAGIMIPPLIYLGANWREGQKQLRNETQYYQKIAVEIRQLSASTDKIFVWGRVAEFYYFSQRLPASRFINSDFVVGMNTYNYYDKTARIDTVASFRMVEALLNDLRKNSPKLIIDTSPQNLEQYGKYPVADVPRLRDFINQNYALAKSIDRLQIYARKF